MKTKKKKILFAVLTSVFAVLTAGAVTGGVIANKYEAAVNAFLNIKTSTSTGGNGGNYFPTDYATAVENQKASQALVEEVESEGAVLLMNKDNALPLSSGNKVTCLGKTSEDIITTGTGSSGMSQGDISLTDSFALANLEVNPTLADFYKNGKGASYSRCVQDGALNNVIKDNSTSFINEVPLSEYSDTEWNSVASYGDAAIVFIGRIGGEGGDIPLYANGDGNGNQLSLTDNERNLLAKTKELKDAGKVKKIIVLFNGSNPVELDFLNPSVGGKDYGIDAAMWIGETGSTGLDAVGKLLTGVYNPSGKLPDTWCYDNTTSPAVQNIDISKYTNADEQGLTYTGLANCYYEVYQEGIYVGYKYYETRYEDTVLQNAKAGDYDYASTVAYPFGYGLSYSTFSYSNYKLEEETDTSFKFSVSVTNESSVKGKDVVSIYLQQPYTQYDKDNGIEKSAVQLAGYTKVEVDAGATLDNVEITVDKDVLKAYDAKTAKTYIRDAGDYFFALGNGSHEAVNNILAYKAENGITENGTVNLTKMVGEGNKSLVVRKNYDAIDTTTYAVSKNGTAIENQFDHADLNYIDDDTSNDVTYVSRSDWAGTMPKATLTKDSYTASFVLSANDTIVAGLKRKFEADTSKTWTMPTTKAENGLKLIQFRGVEYDETITVDGKEYSWDDLLDQCSFVEMAKLVAQAFHNTSLVKSVSKPATKDENGAQGFTATLTGGKSSTSYPSEDLRAATFNRDLLDRVGKAMANDGQFTQNKYSGLYGPNANIHRTPYGGRNFEYYSEDAFLSGKSLSSEVGGLQSRGVYAYMKHFALNDQETGRDGISVWSNEQAIREIYLKPFQMAIEESDAHCVMTSFNRVGNLWAGADKNLLVNVLKGEFGMDGMAITDYSSSNSFMDVLLGLQNGSDLWDCSSDKWLTTLNNYRDNAEIVTYLREATKRVLHTVVNSAAMNGISEETEVKENFIWWKGALIGLDCVLGAATLTMAALLVLNILKGRKEDA